MKRAKPLLVRGTPIANGAVPLICAPLVAATADALEAELRDVLAKAPDVIEWRADHFAAIADTARVIDAARRIKAIARETPLIFTRRAKREGGADTPLGDDEALVLYEAVCAARCAELVDFEMSNGSERMARVRSAAHANAIALIASYHDFRATPAGNALIGKFAEGAEAGADVVKVAVMPSDARDVLTLLAATYEAHVALDIPLVSMAMGPLGALSRIAGFLYGSSLTFGVGAGSSAPGQLAIDELRAAIDIVRRASDAGPRGP